MIKGYKDMRFIRENILSLSLIIFGTCSLICICNHIIFKETYECIRQGLLITVSH